MHPPRAENFVVAAPSQQTFEFARLVNGHLQGLCKSGNLARTRKTGTASYRSGTHAEPGSGTIGPGLTNNFLRVFRCDAP